MIQFYGSQMSSAARSRWMLEETGIPYQYNIIKVREGGTRSLEFRAIHPGGKIPVLVDGDFKLAESMAINFYLAEKYRPDMWSNDVAERALIYQWSLWAATNLYPAGMRVLRNTVLLPEIERDPDEVELGQKEAAHLFGVLEGALTGDYLVGGRFTVADVNAGSVVNMLLRAGAAQPGPRIQAWIDRLRARPAFQRSTAS